MEGGERRGVSRPPCSPRSYERIGEAELPATTLYAANHAGRALKKSMVRLPDAAGFLERHNGLDLAAAAVWLDPERAFGLGFRPGLFELVLTDFTNR